MDPNDIIVALDPGGTTGWATAHIYEGELIFEGGQLPEQDHHLKLYDLLTHVYIKADRLHIVCESFEYRGLDKPGLELISKEYIGIARLFTQQYEETSLVMQTASTAKNFVTDAKLKRLEIFQAKTEHRHMHDAFRHLLYYMVIKLGVRAPITTKWLEQKDNNHHGL